MKEFYDEIVSQGWLHVMTCLALVLFFICKIVAAVYSVKMHFVRYLDEIETLRKKALLFAHFGFLPLAAMLTMYAQLKSEKPIAVVGVLLFLGIVYVFIRSALHFHYRWAQERFRA